MKLTKGFFAGAAFVIAMLSACSSTNNNNLTVSGLNPVKFDTTINDKPVKLFVLKNNN